VFNLWPLLGVSLRHIGRNGSASDEQLLGKPLTASIDSGDRVSRLRFSAQCCLVSVGESCLLQQIPRTHANPCRSRPTPPPEPRRDAYLQHMFRAFLSHRAFCIRSDHATKPSSKAVVGFYSLLPRCSEASAVRVAEQAIIFIVRNQRLKVKASGKSVLSDRPPPKLIAQ